MSHFQHLIRSQPPAAFEAVVTTTSFEEGQHAPVSPPAAVFPRHVYVIFAKRKRRFWFGSTWEPVSIATTKKIAQDWLQTAMDRKRYGADPDRKHRPLDLANHYRWQRMSVDGVYGTDSTFTPANPADIFYVHHYGYES